MRLHTYQEPLHWDIIKFDQNDSGERLRNRSWPIDPFRHSYLEVAQFRRLTNSAESKTTPPLIAQ